MFFNSFHFAIFLPVVFLGTWILRRNVRHRNLFLLVASYYFYGAWDWRFLGLILVSTVVDYGCGLLLGVRDAGVTSRDPRRKAILAVSLTTNLGILGFFKYYDFFVASAVEMLATAGIEAHPRTLGIILPVGISFYTFQTLSYTIDLYFGRMTTERSFLNFALFVAFFPQLVAGPIERASHLLPQIDRVREMSWDRISSGFYLVGWGLFKKVVLADNVAIVVDRVFASPEPDAGAVLIGIYGFAIQIYCDFSGYSDIARGTARMLGFDLMLNFNLPYFSKNPSEFWRRWHISLSSWLRDYLYISIGGNRRGTRRTYVNLMTTMVLGGLWHGAAWTFVVWGIYQGTLLCVHRWAQPWLSRVIRPRSDWGRRLWWAVRVVVFFQFVCIGWLIFRAESMAQVLSMLGALASPAWVRPDLPFDAVRTVVLCFGLLGVVQAVQYASDDLNAIQRVPVPVRGLLYALAILAFVWTGEFNGEAFIYFQF